MPYANSKGVQLYYEEAGKGVPVVFVHEFAGDIRAWEPQLRYFSRRYRCIAFNARGYPPSDVPASVADRRPGRSTNAAVSRATSVNVAEARNAGSTPGTNWPGTACEA